MHDVDPALTVVERLKASLETAAAHNPNDAVQPAAILWTDPDARWQPIIPQLLPLMPHLLLLGEYDPENRSGPAIWLRCVIERAPVPPQIPDGSTPVLYLPGVGRGELGAAESCPHHLKPLVELQYRGACWKQRNGRDWTVEAFLASPDGGLGLDIAKDAATRDAMHRALAELAATPVQSLQGRRLEAEDFDRLFSDDPVRDVLTWMSDSEQVKGRWTGARWNAFRSRCQADFGFDPQKDGDLAAAELLGKREGTWEPVWNRFAESPAPFAGVPELLGKAMPNDLFAQRSSWPQNNEADENVLREALQKLEGPPAAARKKVIELEKKHGERRGWVWAKLGKAPLADALEHLAVLASGASSELGGASIEQMAELYAEEAWKIDDAALRSMAAVKSAADTHAVSRALDAIYRPWLESAARHLQALERPVVVRDRQESYDSRIEPGTVILFADGLRFDVSQRLVELLRTGGRSVSTATQWSAHPTVTATSKPAVSPVIKGITGLSLGEQFQPVTADTERPLTTDRFRGLLEAAGYQCLGSNETGDPSGRAWTEHGEIDKLGHLLKAGLAPRIDDQIELLRERVAMLLDEGWKEVRVVTDHGWLWLPGGLPKVDLPRYLTISRWARCAAIEGGSNVETPVVSWDWNPQERIAVAPGIACFVEGHEYAHGGLSLQESLVPVIRITGGAGSGTVDIRIADLSWVGFRCRVRVEPVLPGLSVDLRTRIGDANSSVSTARPVDGDGAASLLVGDDELEGTTAAIVVLDAGGQVIAQQSTIIGGEQ